VAPEVSKQLLLGWQLLGVFMPWGTEELGELSWVHSTSECIQVVVGATVIPSGMPDPLLAELLA
jgi:hypothetical protein